MGKHRKPEKPKRSSSGGGHGANNMPLGKQRAIKAGLLFDARPDWHASDVPAIHIPDQLKPVPSHILDRVQKHAASLLEAETKLYAATQLQSSSSHKFYSTIMSSGTWGDKVSALTLLVQESPIHTTKYFENLLGLAGKKTRSQALIALGAIKDMMAQGVLLPTDRKLRMFSKQPGLLAAFQNCKPSWSSSDSLPGNLSNQHLVLWAFEDWLKHKYFDVLKILEGWCNDEVEFSRLRAIQFVWELLKEKPEQEENLLRLLVNKLGDTSKKVASKTSHLLLQMQITHPSMKAIIVASIESEILLRSGQASHARYYAIITLNQTVLSTGDPTLANKLLEVYFSMFVAILNRARQIPNSSDSKKRKREGTSVEEKQEDQQLEEKITAQVLTGINRAFPYSKGDSATFEKHIDTMFRISHSSNFNTGVQALMLIQQISTSHHITTDRFMRTLYESLLDPRLLSSSKQTMYLNLLYRSLKSDGSIRRVRAFVKRLLQILSLHEPPFVTAALFLLVELCNIFPSLKSMLEQPELHDEDEEEVFRDVPEDGDSVKQLPSTSAITSSTNAYDPRKRDPLHAHADSAAAWELPPYLSHYHPSVAVFASSLLEPSSIGKSLPKPDPSTHTLMHFLDRFVYRNPKAPTTTVAVRGSSLMQPALASTNTTDSLFRSGNPDAIDTPLNNASFWERKAVDVQADEVFFHRYFGELAPRRRAALAKKSSASEGKHKRAVDDEDGEWDEEVGAGEDEIWKALVGSKPELEGGDDDDGEEDSGFDDESDVGAGDLDDDEEMDREFAAAMASDDDDEDDAGVEMDFDDFSGSEGDIDIPMDFGDGDGDDDDDDEGVELNMDSDVDDDDEEEQEEQPMQKKSKIRATVAALDDDDEDQREEEGDNKKEEKVLTEEQKKREERKKERKRRKALPMFADVSEYAKMLENDSEGEGNDDGQWK